MNLSELFEVAKTRMKELEYKFNLTTCLAFMYLEGSMTTSESLKAERYFEKVKLNMSVVHELYVTNVKDKNV